MPEIFSITNLLWIKTTLSVSQLARLCQCSPAGRSFLEKERYCGKIYGKVDAVKLITHRKTTFRRIGVCRFSKTIWYKGSLIFFLNFTKGYHIKEVI